MLSGYIVVVFIILFLFGFLRNVLSNIKKMLTVKLCENFLIKL